MLKTKKRTILPKASPHALKLLLGAALGLAILLPRAAFSIEEQPQVLAENQTPQWVERYILEHHPVLLENSETDHVLAFYYFGSYQDFTIFGMERVKGSDYLSHNTVLIFNDSQLQGYYQELTVFPAGVNAEGEVFFPPNYPAVQNIDLEAGNYPVIQFQQEIERFKRGDLEMPPQRFQYKKL